VYLIININRIDILDYFHEINDVLKIIHAFDYYKYLLMMFEYLMLLIKCELIVEEED
jgi:hypothetical protein